MSRWNRTEREQTIGSEKIMIWGKIGIWIKDQNLEKKCLHQFHFAIIIIILILIKSLIMIIKVTIIRMIIKITMIRMIIKMIMISSPHEFHFVHKGFHFVIKLIILIIIIIKVTMIITIISSPHEFHFVHEGLPHARHKRSIPHSRKLKTDPQVRIWLVRWSLYWPLALCMYRSSPHPINRETGYSNVLKCEHTDLKGVLLSPLFDTHGKLSVLCPLRHIHAGTPQYNDTNGTPSKFL